MAEEMGITVRPAGELSKQSASTFAPRTLQEAITFAEMVVSSGMAPKAYTKPAQVVIAIQLGMEVGLQPMQALQSIAVINGNPSLWGDGALALVRSSPAFEGIIENTFEEIRAAKKAVCKIKRRGEDWTQREFSYEDAVKAGLKGKTGPWTQYPERMMQMRARAFAIRDVFPDCLKGLAVAEEVADYTHTIDAVDNSAPPTPPTPASDPGAEVITLEQAKDFHALWKKNQWTAEDVKEYLTKILLMPEGSNTRQMTRAQLEKAVGFFSKTPAQATADAQEMMNADE